MSPTSYRTAPPRDEESILNYQSHIVKLYYRIFDGPVSRNAFTTADDGLAFRLGAVL
jgi:hypothetical protein